MNLKLGAQTLPQVELFIYLDKCIILACLGLTTGQQKLLLELWTLQETILSMTLKTKAETILWARIITYFLNYQTILKIQLQILAHSRAGGSKIFVSLKTEMLTSTYHIYLCDPQKTFFSENI